MFKAHEGGLFHGQGVYTFADGTTLTEVFEYGKLPEKPEEVPAEESV